MKDPSFSEQEIVLILNNSWLICVSTLADYQVVSSLVIANHFFETAKQLMILLQINGWFTLHQW